MPKNENRKADARTRHGSTTRHAGQSADVNSKEIFGNHRLLAQFLKDYSGEPLLSDVKPEDIEDVTERYHLYGEVEFSSDTVKKITLRREESPLYVISLIDHKSSVDYNVSMQLLKYMVCIWSNWEAEMRDRNLGGPSLKDFRYPPILPIVYYEGRGKWTAGMKLSDRIFMSECFADYIPDFTYKLVNPHDYSSEELLGRGDEMSLIMLLDRIQSTSDVDELKGLKTAGMNEITARAPEDVRRIMAAVSASLLRRLNVPQDEANGYIHEVIGGNMGYLFENMEKMDIQAERRKTAEAQEKLDKAQEKLGETQEKLDKAQIEIVKKDNEIAKKDAEISKKNDEITKKDDEILKKNAEIANLKAQLSAEKK